MTIKVPARQYRYPDLVSPLERKQNALDEVEVPVNRKVRKGRVIYVR